MTAALVAPPKKKSKAGWAAFAFVVVCALVWLLGQGYEENAEMPDDPLVQASLAFDGNDTAQDIRHHMDLAFAATDTPGTDDSYRRAGSTLVALKQEYGIAEMDILKCIPSKAQDPRLAQLSADPSFANVAALCTAILTGAEPP